MSNIFKKISQKSILEQLNQLKKENPEKRKLQNKRYRDRSILNLKKRLSYQKKKYLVKLNSI